MDISNAMPWIASIIVAVVSGVFSYLGVTTSSKAAHDLTMLELKKEQESQKDLLNEKIGNIREDIKRLEVKQDKHNNIIERTFKLEQRVDDLIKQIN